MNNDPCPKCVLYAICQNKTMIDKWNECPYYMVYKQSRGWQEWDGRLCSTRSRASTTYMKIGNEYGYTL